VSNCRPVSLFISFSKLFENVLWARILKHHTKYHILSNEHYGLRVGLKIDKAIYKLEIEILNAMNHKP